MYILYIFQNEIKELWHLLSTYSYGIFGSFILSNPSNDNIQSASICLDAINVYSKNILQKWLKFFLEYEKDFIDPFQLLRKLSSFEILFNEHLSIQKIWIECNNTIKKMYFKLIQK